MYEDPSILKVVCQISVLINFYLFTNWFWGRIFKKPMSKRFYNVASFVCIAVTLLCIGMEYFLFKPPAVLYPFEHMPLHTYMYKGFIWGFGFGSMSFFIKKKNQHYPEQDIS